VENAHAGPPIEPASQEGESVLTFFPRIQSTTPGAFFVAAGAEPAPGYRLKRVRGRGGFAEVWEADSPSGPVALKFMISANTGTTARELRSLQSLQALDHPFLVKTQSVFTVPGYIVIAMELAEGTLLDLHQVYLNDLNQLIDPRELCHYLWQVADALDFLNARRHTRDGRKVGFQHGDVKPNNVLLFGDVAKLTDYGLATATHGPTTPCPRHGTRDYAAPEVQQGHLTDTSDQYSLAVTYCVLRSGRFPFPPQPAPGEGQPAKSAIQPPPELPGFLPGEKVALGRAMALAPQARFPCCRDLMKALIKANGLKVVWSDEGSWRIVTDEETLPDTPATRPNRDSKPFRR
jgi:serine/threonine protein kinase